MSQQLGQGLAGEKDLWQMDPQKLELAQINEEQVKRSLEYANVHFERLRLALH